jgi:hypothetical protein
MRAFHDACYYMLRKEGFTELGPPHMVSRMGGGETSPPCSGITYKLLGYKQRLLILCTLEDLELGLNGAEPMVSFQRLTCFSESQRLGGQKLHIRASFSVSSNADSGAFTVGVGHEVAQQLGLLNPRLMDGCENLSQGRRRRRVPIRLSGLGICTSFMSAHHAAMQMTYY